MSWRKAKLDDIHRGVVLRHTGMKDTPFNCGTVIALGAWGDSGGQVVVARPIAYAYGSCDAKNPLVGSDTFLLDLNKPTDWEEIEVYVDADSKVRKMTV
jgi:hypothetical protein